MPFFQGATRTNASHARFNDVAGDQFNENDKKHFAGDNHDYRAPVHRGDSYGQVNGGVVGGSGNINAFAQIPQANLKSATTSPPATALSTADNEDDEDDDGSDDELYQTQKQLLEIQHQLKRSQEQAKRLTAELEKTKQELASTRAQLSRAGGQ